MTRRLGLLLAAVVMAACGNGEERPVDDRPVCEVRFAAPGGFEPLPAFEEDYPDHVGVRLGFRDQGRQFHVLAGIPGEIGEGLPVVGSVELTEGRTARLLGRDDVWIVVWEENDRCDPRAVIGNGFSRRTFREALAEAGLV